MEHLRQSAVTGQSLSLGLKQVSGSGYALNTSGNCTVEERGVDFHRDRGGGQEGHMPPALLLGAVGSGEGA